LRAKESYKKWNLERLLNWKVDNTQSPQWLHIDFIMTCWNSKAKLDVRRPTIKLPQNKLISFNILFKNTMMKIDYFIPLTKIRMRWSRKSNIFQRYDGVFSLDLVFISSL